MKRTPLKRKTPLKSRTPLRGNARKRHEDRVGATSERSRSASKAKRSTARKRARKEARFRKQFHSKERVAFVGSLPCAACGRVPTKKRPSRNHHDPTKGSGAGYHSISPLCDDCHTRRHSVGWSVKRFWQDIPGGYERTNRETQEAWERHLTYRGNCPIIK